MNPTDTQTNDGGPYHPSPPIPDATDGRAVQRDGASLRDEFAKAAMQGDLSSQAENWHTISPATSDEDLLANALLYYRIADAMLIARALPAPSKEEAP